MARSGGQQGQGAAEVETGADAATGAGVRKVQAHARTGESTVPAVIDTASRRQTIGRRVGTLGMAVCYTPAAPPVNRVPACASYGPVKPSRWASRRRVA